MRTINLCFRHVSFAMLTCPVKYLQPPRPHKSHVFLISKYSCESEWRNGSKRVKYLVMQKQENESDEIKRTIFTLLLRFTSSFNFGSQISDFLSQLCFSVSMKGATPKTTCFSSCIEPSSFRLYLNHLDGVFFLDLKLRKGSRLWF